LHIIFNFACKISSVCTSLPAGKAWNYAGDYKQRRAAAKPAACHTHSMHRRRSASYFGICDSRPAISPFMPNSTGETPVEIPRHGPSFQIWGFCAHHSPPIRVKFGTLDKASHNIICRAKFCSDRCIVSNKHALVTQSSQIFEIRGLLYPLLIKFCTLEQTLSTCQISPGLVYPVAFGGKNLQILRQL